MVESFESKKKRAMKILRRLKKTYPNAKSALNFKTPIQFLVAVILSAQTTDEQVNKTTKELFRKYKTVDDFAGANLKTFTKEVNSVNFYKNKAKFIKNSAKMLKKEYGGKFPNDINELVKFPGVARKTANIVQYQIYKKAEGVTVDTHVKRVAFNLNLTDKRDPVKIEQDLMKLYPEKEWGRLGFYFQAYGRAVMPARGKPSMKDTLYGLY